MKCVAVHEQHLMVDLQVQDIGSGKSVYHI